MITQRLLVLVLALAAVGIGVAASPSLAQTYPSRNIRFIVPFAAGSATDALARIVGEHVSRSLGQPVVIENMGTSKNPVVRAAGGL
jgi:tripartite-type tricarboxylate transporter receptor subunit TctC